MLSDNDSPTPSESSLPGPSEDSEEKPALTREILISTYRTVWDQFYKWEKTYCEDALRPFSQIPLRTNREDEEILHTRVDIEDYRRAWPVHAVSVAEEDCGVVKVENMKTGGVETFEECTIVCPELEPVPVYEACTPSNINVGPRRYDLLEWETLRFFPYLDNPRFTETEKMKLASYFEHGYFQWTAWDECTDPDR